MDTAFIYLTLWAGVFAVIFAMLIKKGWILGAGGGAKGRVDKSFVSRKWREIETLMQQQKPSSYKVAVMDADKLVDYVLKAKVGTDGNMGERLKKAQKLFSSYSDYQNLWEAHKMRNRIAHEADHEVHFAEAKKNISYFKKALKDLGAL
ncbi:hypothetical protein C4544_07080 [candidate division WS5 bacterium]|uniref:DUF4145 domain-containing protein n=1 Tax=candidate division WS5 bacterium TaxID=2093353 RepID=A0A419DAJ4_9BACT|nr:MAG: hypothetical protein C4544_07080 [candidate division WS5 bacterium]